MIKNFINQDPKEGDLIDYSKPLDISVFTSQELPSVRVTQKRNL
jgi:hypothetical protein